MTDTALVGGICVDIRKSMSRFADAYDTIKFNGGKGVCTGANLCRLCIDISPPYLQGNTNGTE
ncbi:hypothetical protein AB4186_09910 [Vibrio lentus]